MQNTLRTMLALAGLACSALWHASALAGEINVNTADARTLAAELDGVGLAKAEAIVAYREAHGEFASVAELAQVKGIGARTLEINRDNIRFRDD